MMLAYPLPLTRCAIMIANGARIDGIELGYNQPYGHTSMCNPMRPRLQPYVVQVQPEVLLFTTELPTT